MALILPTAGLSWLPLTFVGQSNPVTARPAEYAVDANRVLWLSGIVNPYSDVWGYIAEEYWPDHFCIMQTPPINNNTHDPNDPLTATTTWYGFRGTLAVAPNGMIVLAAADSSFNGYDTHLDGLCVPLR